MARVVLGAAALTDDHELPESATSLLSSAGVRAAWMGGHPRWEPCTLLVDDGPDAQAIARLARRRIGPAYRYVAVPPDGPYESPLSTVGRHGPTRLARELYGWLRSTRSPWVIELRQLDPSSRLHTALADVFPVRTLTPTGGRLVTRLSSDVDPDKVMSRNARSAEAKALNRIEREGCKLVIDLTTNPEEIDAAMPEVFTIHRERDVQLRGHSLLDDPAERYYYLGVRSALAGRWLLLSLRIDGTLAAYALCLRDGDSLRVWDNKMSPGYARFSPGLLANMALVRCASADGQIALVDWGPGMQRYKASLSNDLIPSQTLTAWSSQLFRRTLSGAQHVKQLAHRRWPARSCRMVSRA